MLTDILVGSCLFYLYLSNCVTGEACIATNSLYILTGSTLYRQDGNDERTICADGFTGARDFDVDSNGVIYVVDELLGVIYRIASDCGEKVALNSVESYVTGPRSITLDEVQDGTTVLYVAMAHADPNFSENLYPNLAQSRQVYSFRVNADGVLDPTYAIAATEEGRKHEFITYIEWNEKTNTLWGIERNKFVVQWDGKQWARLPEITSIVDMRQIDTRSFERCGYYYITADDNNQVFRCSDINDPTTCQPSCGGETLIINPWALAVDESCNYYAGSTGATTVVGFNLRQCGTGEIIADLSVPVYGIHVINNGGGDPSKCKPKLRCGAECKIPTEDVPLPSSPSVSMASVPTCATVEFECKPDEIRKTDSTECKNADDCKTICCNPTCKSRNYQCGANKENHLSYNSITCSSDDQCATACCTVKPACAKVHAKSPIKCGENQYVSADFSVTCGKADGDCVSVCCVDNEQCPASCTDSKVKSSDMYCQSQGNCQNCCQPTCESSSHVCANGFEKIDQFSVTVCNDNQDCDKKCCVKSAGTCTSNNHDCGPQFSSKTAFETINCENAEECQKSCCDPLPTCESSSHVCANGFENIEQFAVTTCSNQNECDSKCCVKSAGTCTSNSHDCGPRYSAKASFDTINCENKEECQDACCDLLPTCESSNHVCANGFENIEQFAVVTCNNQEECDVKCCVKSAETCASNSHDCGSKFSAKVSFDTINCESDEECQKVCCDPLPTCESSNHKCGDGFEKSKLFAVTLCNNKEECDAKCCSEIVIQQSISTCSTILSECGSKFTAKSDFETIECENENECQKVCCDPKPTCEDNEVECDADREPKSSYGTINCSIEKNDCQSKCCKLRVTTCKTNKHNCGAKFDNKPDFDTIECEDKNDCQKVCCDAKPTCSDNSVECDADREAKPSYNTIVCSLEKNDCQSKCCKLKVKTCETTSHKCGPGTEETNSFDTTECTDEFDCQDKCCQDIPKVTCKSTGHSCGVDFNDKESFDTIECAANTCTEKECCDAKPKVTCKSSSHACGADYNKKKSFDTIECAAETCTQGECCDAKPKITCKSSSYACTADYNNKAKFDTIECAADTCTQEECCDAKPKVTCKSSNHDCGADFNDKAAFDTIECVADACTEKECCDAKPKVTCKSSSHECGANFNNKAAFDTIECAGDVCTEKECCDAKPKVTCKSTSHSCGVLFNNKKAYDTIECAKDTCTENECCDAKPTCKSRSHNCGEEYENNKLFDVIPCNDDSDCQLKCCTKIVAIKSTPTPQPSGIQCLETNSYYLLTEEALYIERANGDREVCVTGLSGARDFEIDSNGNIFILDEYINAIYRVEKGCGASKVIAAHSNQKFVAGPRSITLKENDDGSLTMYVAMLHGDSESYDNKYPDLAKNRQVYSFPIDKDGNWDGDYEILATPDGRAHEYISFVEWNDETETLWGIERNKFIVQWDGTNWNRLPEITDIVDMRAVSTRNFERCGFYAISADDNNRVFKCTDLADPKTCTSTCGSEDILRNPWGVAIDDNCNVISTSSGGNNVVGFNEDNCASGEDVAVLPRPVFGVKVFNDGTGDSSLCEEPKLCVEPCVVQEIFETVALPPAPEELPNGAFGR